MIATVQLGAVLRVTEEAARGLTHQWRILLATSLFQAEEAVARGPEVRGIDMFPVIVREIMVSPVIAVREWMAQRLPAGCP